MVTWNVLPSPGTPVAVEGTIAPGADVLDRVVPEQEVDRQERSGEPGKRTLSPIAARTFLNTRLI